jgi:flagellar hook-basal body complex protein FliE
MVLMMNQKWAGQTRGWIDYQSRPPKLKAKKPAFHPFSQIQVWPPPAYHCATEQPDPEKPPMDMRITPLTPQALGALAKARLQQAEGTGNAVGGPGFSDAFKNALQSVSTAQNQASRLQNEVQLGNPSVSLEETMLAMQKAQIGFQAALNVRNRMVQAYTDVMNMQV